MRQRRRAARSRTTRPRLTRRAMYRQGELAGRSGAEGIVILDFGRPGVDGSVYGTFGYGNVLIPF